MHVQGLTTPRWRPHVYDSIVAKDVHSVELRIPFGSDLPVRTGGIRVQVKSVGRDRGEDFAVPESGGDDRARHDVELEEVGKQVLPTGKNA